ncbi:outer membrane beta-barrel protein [Candidatus Dependentiae bacterium]|nr:outer membrane beta-barrel protein [Candidatus Dependentiae bacterium]
MNKKLTILLISLFISIFVYGDFNKGDKEVSFSLTASKVSRAGEYSYNYENVNLFFRYGYFFNHVLELEPELMAGNDSILFSTNLNINLRVNEKSHFFIITGIGYGNSFNFGTLPLWEGSNLTAVNIGVGFKFNFSESLIFRVELRRTEYYGAEEKIWEYQPSGYYERTEKIHYYTANFMFGFSYIFKIKKEKKSEEAL